MIDVGKGKIDEITVFTQGAYVTRTAEVTLQQGLNQVRFSGFSSRYNKSYDASCSSGKILSVCADSDMLIDYTDDFSKKEAVLQQEIYTLQTQKAVLKTETQFWVNNNQLIGSVSDKDLEHHSEFIRLKQFQLQKKLWDRQHRLDEAKKTLQQLQELEKNYDRANLGSACVIEIFSEQKCNSQVSINLFTSYASWTPVYKIEKNGAKLNIILQGALTQNTNEDWQSKVTFVTGSPTQCNILPEFEPQYLNQKKPQPMPMARMMSASMDNNIEDDSQAFSPQITQQENENSLTFKPNYEVTAKSGMTAVIQLLSNTVKAKYEYKCFASVDNRVYLMANIDAYRFINAKASVFINGIFSGTTRVTPALRQITLAKEDGITVRRIVGNSYKTDKLLGGNKTECDFKLEVCSSKSGSVNINIIDRIPLTSNKNIDVVATCVSGANIESGSGKLEFNLKLAPNKPQILNIVYEIITKS